MEVLAELAKEKGLVVVSDEIYTAFSFQYPFIPFASIPGMKERTITIKLCIELLKLVNHGSEGHEFGGAYRGKVCRV